MLATSVILMFLMVAGVAPDVMNHEGMDRKGKTLPLVATEAEEKPRSGPVRRKLPA